MGANGLMYEKIEVWQSSADNEHVFVFVCFKELVSSRYFVQSIDAIRPGDTGMEIGNIRKNTIELFLETSISERSQGFPSLREAIEDAKVWGEIP